MSLSEIRTTLREIGVAPVKSLGQNFLHDRNLARWIVDRAALSPDDYVVEIGPGLGALTDLILSKGAKVLAIERDARLVHFLRGKFKDRAIEIFHADALKFDERNLYARRNAKLLGNLPYYISSQLVMKFLTYPSPITFSLLMLQKEMARRLSAGASTKDYGALTLRIQLHYRVELVRAVASTVFVPRPGVDSALVQIIPRAPGELPYCDYGMFEKLVRNGFSQRRKQLRKLLANEIPTWNEAVAALKISRQVRAEDLSLEQWVALTNFASPVAIAESESRYKERFSVVDQADQVIGEALRAKVHGNNLLHRAVHILIFNEAGEVYLQKRSPLKDRHPLLWDSSASGHVAAGEDYDAAAKRELHEELGIEARLRRVVKLPASEKTDFEFIWVYCGCSEGPFELNPREIECGDFFSVAVVDEWIVERSGDFAPGFKKAWKSWRSENPPAG